MSITTISFQREEEKLQFLDELQIAMIERENLNIHKKLIDLESLN